MSACAYVIKANGEEYQRLFAPTSPQGQAPRLPHPISGASPAIPSSSSPVQTENESAAPEPLTKGAKSPPPSTKKVAASRGKVEREGEWHKARITTYSATCNTPKNSTQTSSGIPLKAGVVSFAVPKHLRHLMGKTIEVRFRGKTYVGVVTDRCGTSAIDIFDGDLWSPCKSHTAGQGEWRLLEAK